MSSTPQPRPRIPLALSAPVLAAGLLAATASHAQQPYPQRVAPAPIGYAAWPSQPAPYPYPYSQPYPAAYPAQATWAPPTPAAPPDAGGTKRDRESSVSFDLAAVTKVPILVGGQATLELPHGILLQGDVGVLPAAYVGAVDGALTGAGAYDATTSELVRNGLDDSLVVGLSAGWRPFPDHGLELMGGYTLVSLGGGVSAKGAIEAATGATLPAQIPDERIALHTTLHNVHASLGWRWLIADHVVVRASLGYLQTVSSSSRVDAPSGTTLDQAAASQLSAVNRVVDSTLNDAYTSYVKLPVVALSLGYRF